MSVALGILAAAMVLCAGAAWVMFRLSKEEREVAEAVIPWVFLGLSVLFFGTCVLS